MFNLLRKILKVSFYILIVVFLWLLVDFRDMSLKTILPKAQVKIENSEGVEGGIINKTQKITFKKEFEGTVLEIVELTNQAREKKGLQKLKINKKLALSAMDKAKHLKINDYFEHVSPQGLQPWYFAQKRNYNYKTFGENLAKGYFSAKSVHEGWMNSPGHRKNILSPNFEEIGVAILDFSEDDQRSYLIVQHFGALLKPEEEITKTVCNKDSKENCEDAKDKEDELEELIEEQEDIIDEAEKKGVTKKSLERLEENLEDLEEAEEEIEDYLEECEEFIEKCDVFE